MTTSPEIDVRDLNSVRRAAEAEAEESKRKNGEVLLGDDWVTPGSGFAKEMRERRRTARLIKLNSSPLARKIITFNLVALILLVTGMLYFMPSRDNLAFQRANGLVSEAELIADVFEAQLPVSAPVNLVTGDGVDVALTLSGLDLRRGVEAYVFDSSGTLIDSIRAEDRGPADGLSLDTGGTLITNFLNTLWEGLAGLLAPSSAETQTISSADSARALVEAAISQGTRVEVAPDILGNTIFAAATPIEQGDRPVGVLALTTAAGEIDALVRREREQLLQMFVIGVLVSIGLSLVLASTIANPIADLAAAAEMGRDRNARKMTPEKIRIPDLSSRPDEIGRLSSALRGMVSALYERIESNEQFAADVSHEIKNPLASLQSAVGTMRIAKKPEQRERMLEVIEHDIKRLDRLVTDISKASRLDSELVKETEEAFDLVKTLSNLNEYLSKQAEEKGVEFIEDLPNQPILIHGLEARLAQVFVNLISNATSFCEEGDAIRVWCRQRENRVLVVVEDTGPGIPENALAKVFQRFYSERPANDFGNNSGLGLAISKQIVEAHDGVIWAENIRPTEADVTSDPLGARFVVGLPI